MKTTQYLILNKNGIVRTTKSKPSLKWNEISMRVEISVPNELFDRPIISAKLDIKDIPVVEFNPQVIIDTKELIEQQTGAKIEFSVIYDPKEESKE